MRKASEKPLLALIEAGGLNDMPVVVPAAATSDTLIEALRTVRAAGYRVSKPRKPKTFKRGKDRVGPTFVAKFADGEVTRMTTFTSLEKLDWNRGVALSYAAWQSRWWTRTCGPYLKQASSPYRKPYPVALVAPLPPTIIEAHFEQDGKVLARSGLDGNGGYRIRSAP
jgi:hypothetical protein